MKKNKRILLVIILVIILIVTITVGVVIWNKQKENAKNENQILTEENNEGIALIDWNNTDNVKIENDEKVNESDALKEDKTLEGMKVTNIELSTESGITNFKATVENTTNKDFEGKAVIMTFTNKDGSELAKLEGFLADVPKQGSNVIDASTTADIANAYDFKIEISK